MANIYFNIIEYLNIIFGSFVDFQSFGILSVNMRYCTEDDETLRLVPQRFCIHHSATLYEKQLLVVRFAQYH